MKVHTPMEETIISIQIQQEPFQIQEMTILEIMEIVQKITELNQVEV